MSSFLGVPIKTDESMLDNKVKFVQHDGKEIVLDLKTGDMVIDLVSESAADSPKLLKSAQSDPKRKANT